MKAFAPSVRVRQNYSWLPLNTAVFPFLFGGAGLFFFSWGNDWVGGRCIVVAAGPSVLYVHYTKAPRDNGVTADVFPGNICSLEDCGVYRSVNESK